MEPKEVRQGNKITGYGWWPEHKRLEVVTAFCAGITNATELERLTRVPAETIRRWKCDEWWLDLVEKVRNEKDQEFDSKATKVIEKTLDTIIDRLDNGDYHISKSGQISRKYMSGKDAAQVAAIMVDKRNLLRGKPTSRVERMSESDKLKQLADQFRAYVKGRVLEGEFTKVLGDEENDRQEGQEIYSEERGGPEFIETSVEESRKEAAQAG